MKTCCNALLLSLLLSAPAYADLFLVKTSEGPGFKSPQEAAEVLEKGIIPTFNFLLEMEKQKKIVAGGLPAGSRTFYLMVEANSAAEVDAMLRDIPAWGVFSWKVVPLQTIKGRADIEKKILRSIRE